MSLSLETVSGWRGLHRVIGGVHGDDVQGRVAGGVPQDVPNQVVLLGLGGVSAGVRSGVPSEVPSRAGGEVPSVVPSRAGGGVPRVVPSRAEGGVPGWVPS